MPAPPVDFSRCNCTALRKASRRISQMYDEELSPTGLKSTQMAILVEIDRRKLEESTLRRLADALVMDRSTLGQNLKPLEREGLITIGAGKEDQRRRHVALTKLGQDRLHAAQALWVDAQTRFEKNFGEQEAAVLRSTLQRIVRDDSLYAPASPP